MPAKSAASRSGNAASNDQAILQAQYLTEAKKKKDLLLTRLSDVARVLGNLPQQYSGTKLNPLAFALVSEDITQHRDSAVRTYAASCLIDIMRIFAPDHPFSDDELFNLFQCCIQALKLLQNPESAMYATSFHILERMSTTKSFLLLLDMEDDKLLVELFRVLLAVSSSSHPHKVTSHFVSILCDCVQEADGYLSPELLELLLTSVIDDTPNSGAPYIAKHVLSRCADSLEPSVSEYILAVFSGKHTHMDSELKNRIDDLVFQLQSASPVLLLHVLPQVAQELFVDNKDRRLQVTKLWCKMFQVSDLAQTQSELWNYWLGRFEDAEAEIRVVMVQAISEFAETKRELVPTLVNRATQRLLDAAEAVRLAAVKEICNVLIKSPQLELEYTLRTNLEERLADKKLSVRKVAVKMLAQLFSTVTHLAGFDYDEWDDAYTEQYGWIPDALVKPRSGTGDVYIRCYFDIQLDETILGSGAGDDETRASILSVFIQCLGANGRKSFETYLNSKKALQDAVVGFVHAHDAVRNKEDRATEKLSVAVQNLAQQFDPTGGRAPEHLMSVAEQKDNKVFAFLSKLVDAATPSPQLPVLYKDLKSKITQFCDSHTWDYMATVVTHAWFKPFAKEIVQVLVDRVGTKSKLSKPALATLSLLCKVFPTLLTDSQFATLSQQVVAKTKILNPDIAQVLSYAAARVETVNAALPGKLRAALEICTKEQEAKFGSRVLLRLRGHDDEVKKFLSSLLSSLDGALPNPDSVFRCLLEIARSDSPVLDDDSSDARSVFDFMRHDVLPQSAALNGKSKSSTSKKKTKSAAKSTGTSGGSGSGTKAYGSREKVLALKIVVELAIRSAKSAAGTSDVASTVISLLVDMLKECAEDESVLLGTVASLVKCINSSTIERLFNIQQFQTIAYLHTNEQCPVTVRSTLLTRLTLAIASNFRISLKWAAILALSASADTDLKSMAHPYLQQIIRTRRSVIQTYKIKINSKAAANLLPEYILPPLIHTLVHHPNFQADSASNLTQSQKTLSNFLTAVMQGVDNFQFLMQILNMIKTAQDAQDSANTGIYVLAETAMTILKHKSLNRTVANTSAPEIYLGTMFFSHKPNNNSANQTYLPDSFHLENTTPRKPAVNTSFSPRKHPLSLSTDENTSLQSSTLSVADRSPKKVKPSTPQKVVVSSSSAAAAAAASPNKSAAVAGTGSPAKVSGRKRTAKQDYSADTGTSSNKDPFTQSTTTIASRRRLRSG